MKTINPAYSSACSVFIGAAITLTATTFCFNTQSASGETVVGSGHVVSETRTVSGFHGVELSGSGELAITQGDTEGLVIEAEDNIQPLLNATVGSDGVLHLGFKEHQGRVETKKGVVFKLSAKTLDRLVTAGSGNIQADSISSETARLELRGSGDITVNHLKANDFSLKLAGSGNVKLAGEAHGQKIEVDGSGGYEAPDFKTDDATVRVNGSGTVKIWASKSLSVEINGSGDISYYGQPSVKKSVHGSGEVTALGEKGN